MNCFTHVSSCPLMLHIHVRLANNLSLLHKDVEGQGASETLLHAGRKANTQLHINEVVLPVLT